jgi:4-amino-4-deoxy-L-arabinose transferase-like glycosyltransferase
LITAVIMLTNLGGTRLWDRDEPRNAGCAAEMLARGDWIVPVFNGELRTHKPVLLYWLILAAYQLFGINEFAARLPSALAAIGTALCTCELGRHFVSARAGLWAGIAVATSLMFGVAGRAATPDSLLIFWSTLAVTCFALGIDPDGKPNSALDECSGPVVVSRKRAICVFAAMGMAALAKGPVGVVLPTATIGLFQVLATTVKPASRSNPWLRWLLAISQRLTPRRLFRAALSLRPITALVVVCGVAVPWYVWVGLRTDGEFLRGFFWEHNLGRALQTMEGHRGNVLFYPVTMLAGLFPWSVFAAPLVLDAVRNVRQTDHGRPQRGYLLATCWIAVYLGIFSLAKTKLPSYVTPTYPAVALCVGTFVDRWLSGQVTGTISRRWLEAACCVLACVGLVFLVAIPLVLWARLPEESWLGAIGLVPLIGGLAAWWSVRRDCSRQAVGWVAAVAAGFATLLFALGADRVDRHQQYDRVLSAIEGHTSQPRVAAFACLEPSWVFYGGRPIDEITQGNVGPTHAPWIAINEQWSPKPIVSMADVAARGEDALILTTRQHLEEARRHLPGNFSVLASTPLFLKDDELVLLGIPKTRVAKTTRLPSAAGR